MSLCGASSRATPWRSTCTLPEPSKVGRTVAFYRLTEIRLIGVGLLESCTLPKPPDKHWSKTYERGSFSMCTWGPGSS